MNNKHLIYLQSYYGIGSETDKFIAFYCHFYTPYILYFIYLGITEQKMLRLVDYSRISYISAAILYQWASSVFLIINSN